jgi:hypothetical protein
MTPSLRLAVSLALAACASAGPAGAEDPRKVRAILVLPELKPNARADAERAIREKARALLTRIAKHEPCLRPQ